MNYVWYKDPGLEAASSKVRVAERLEKLSARYSCDPALTKRPHDQPKSQAVLEEVLDNWEYFPEDDNYVEWKAHNFYIAELEIRLTSVSIEVFYKLKFGDEIAFLSWGKENALTSSLTPKSDRLLCYKDQSELRAIVTEIKSMWEDFHAAFLKIGFSLPEAQAENLIQQTDISHEEPDLDLPFNPNSLAVPFTEATFQDFQSLEAFKEALETHLAANEDDVNAALAHVWAIVKIVETGVHIDDVYEDTKRAVSLFNAVKTKAKEDGFLIAEFEMDLQALLARTKAFADL